MIGGVEGSLRAFDLHVHLLLWRRNGSRSGEQQHHRNRDHTPCMKVTYERVRRMGLMAGDHTAILNDPECDAEMVCVLDDKMSYC